MTDQQRERTEQNVLESTVESLTPSWYEIAVIYALVLFVAPVILVLRTLRWWFDER